MEESWIAHVFEGKDLGHGMMARRIRELEAEVARLSAALDVSHQAEIELLQAIYRLTREAHPA